MNRLDAIKARAEAATPGPWVDDEDWWVCQPGEDGDIIVDGATPPEPSDARFIAHARTDVPLLLAVAEAAAAMFENRFTQWSGLSDDPPAGARWYLDASDLRAALAPLLEPDR